MPGAGMCSTQSIASPLRVSAIAIRSPLARSREAGIPGLPAAQRIEDRAVELDAAFVHRDDLRGRGLQVGIVSEQQLGGHGTT